MPDVETAQISSICAGFCDGAKDDIPELTPQMIEAGVAHLARFHRDRNNEEDIVADIYRAMVLARDQKGRTSP